MPEGLIHFGRKEDKSSSYLIYMGRLFHCHCQGMFCVLFLYCSVIACFDSIIPESGPFKYSIPTNSRTKALIHHIVSLDNLNSRIQNFKLHIFNTCCCYTWLPSYCKLYIRDVRLMLLHKFRSEKKMWKT